MATNQLDELQRQETEAARRERARGGVGSQQIRSDAFLASIAGQTPETRQAQQSRLAQQGLDTTESILNARGLSSSGIGEGLLSSATQNILNVVGAPPRPRSGSGSELPQQQAPRQILPPIGQPAPLRPQPRRSGDGGQGGGGILPRPQVDPLSIDEQPFRDIIAEAQEEFRETQRSPLQGDLPAFTSIDLKGSAMQREARARNQTEFGTLGGNKTITRRAGELLSDFYRRQDEFDSNPQNKTDAELAGLTLRGLATVRSLENNMQEITEGVRDDFTNKIQMGRVAIASAGQSVARLNAGGVQAFGLIKRFLDPNIQANIEQEVAAGLKEEDVISRFSPHVLEEARGKAIKHESERLRRAQSALRQNAGFFQDAVQQKQQLYRDLLADAKQRVKDTAAQLDERQDLRNKGNAAVLKSSALQARGRFDQDLYRRLSRRLGEDPDAINQKTGLPNWQHLRSFTPQREAEGALARFRQAGSGGLSDPRGEFVNMVRQRALAKEKRLRQSSIDEAHRVQAAKEAVAEDRKRRKSTANRR